MALSTVALGLLPTQATLGVMAPILMLMVRLLQGFSCGGELIGSSIFVVEHATREKQGFYGSFATTGLSLGVLIASLTAWLVYTVFSKSQVTEWAWRLPFLLGALGGLLGWLARRQVPETQLFQESIRIPRHYLRVYHEYQNQIRSGILIAGIELFASVLAYSIYVFLVTYMVSILHYTHRQALTINALSNIVLLLLQPAMGKLNDRVGRRPMLNTALIGAIFWTWPYFWLLQQHNVVLALLAQLVMTLFAAAYIAVKGVTIVEIVPVHLRFTVVAFAYAVAVSIFGGATPFIATVLIKTTHSYFSLCWYLTIAALISLFAVYKVRETSYAAKYIKKIWPQTFTKLHATCWPMVTACRK